MPDTQTLGLVIAAAVAGALCVRLYWVLGRRTGAEPSPATAVLATAGVTEFEPATGNGLLDIQAAAPDFDTGKFLGGARDAYGLIVTAFAKGDRAALAPLLSPDVLAAFEAAIAARASGAHAEFIKLTDAKVSGAVLAGRHADITVTFEALFSTGAITDVWTFARDLDAADPNWLLVATSGDVPA
jgi:predicted lipid-binding transport protein (Tim44 family)